MKQKARRHHSYSTRRQQPSVTGEDLPATGGSDIMATTALADVSEEADPTNADLLKAINNLHGSVSSMGTKISGISSTLTSVQESLSTVVGKVHDIEVAVTEHDDRLSVLEAKIASLQTSYDGVRQKLLANELRSRRFNVRVVGPIPEGEEGPDATGFISKLIPSLLGIENFPDGVLVDVAHRIGPKPNAGGRIRAFIARIHYLHVRHQIIKLATQKAPLSYKGIRVSIFPDQPTEVFEQRRKFYSVRDRCKSAGLQSGFVGSRQTRLKITHDGTTRYFDSPEGATRFLDTRLGAADGGDGNGAAEVGVVDPGEGGSGGGDLE